MNDINGEPFLLVKGWAHNMEGDYPVEMLLPRVEGLRVARALWNSPEGQTSLSQETLDLLTQEEREAVEWCPPK